MNGIWWAVVAKTLQRCETGCLNDAGEKKEKRSRSRHKNDDEDLNDLGAIWNADLYAKDRTMYQNLSLEPRTKWDSFDNHRCSLPLLIAKKLPPKENKHGEWSNDVLTPFQPMTIERRETRRSAWSWHEHIWTLSIVWLYFSWKWWDAVLLFSPHYNTTIAIVQQCQKILMRSKRNRSIVSLER